MNRDRFRKARPFIFSLCVLAGLALSNCGGVLDATIGGTVYGLSGGTSVVLVDNGSDPITVPANGTFTFDKSIEAQNTYDVTVQTQPIGETCTVTNGTGTVTQNGGNVTNVAVTCNVATTSSNYVYVTIAGLASGASVTLSDGTSSQAFAANSAAPTAFSTALAYGTSYNVTVVTNPSGQTCTVANATGTISSSGTTAAAVTCQ
jgi:hypothetical protein